MKFDLEAIARRVGKKRSTSLPVITPTQAQAAELAAIYIAIPRLVATFTKERLLPAYRRAVEQRALSDGKNASSPTPKINMLDDVSELERELGFLDLELRRLVLTLTPQMRRWVLRTEAWHRKKWIGGILTAVGVNLDTLVGPDDVRETLAVVLNRNVDLIRNVAEEARAKTADAIWRGWQARSPARDVAKDVQKTLEISRRRAIRIAADQTQKLSAELDAERQRQAGLDHWIWRHGGKVHYRPEHKARDGKLYTDKTAPKDLPGMLPFCSCRRQAHLVID